MRTQSPADDRPQHAGASRPPLVALVGPTAVGKTALSLVLAVAIGGEVVSADSRQVYRHMDIGTAKPTPEERCRVSHHLLDLLDPDQTLGLAEYQGAALDAVDRITSRGHVPVLVGGTGQYVMALVEGWQIPRIPPNSALRRQLYDEAAGGGADALHSRLRDIDPVAAASIDSRNIRRVVRALEICLESGRRVSDLRGKNPTPYEVLMVGLTLSRDELYRRIDQRVDKMIECGLEQEVRGLVSAGYGFDLPAMSGLGYAQFAPLLRGEATLAEVVQAVKRATRRFVRQQANWFRPDDSRIHWYGAAPDPTDRVVELVSRFLDATT